MGFVTPVTQEQTETPHKVALVWCVSSYRIAVNRALNHQLLSSGTKKKGLLWFWERVADGASSPARTWSQTILWYTSCLMLISTSNSESFLSASVLAARMSLHGETCWGKSSMFRRTGKTEEGLWRR